MRTTQIPVLEYKVSGYKLSYRWADCVKGFNMPLKINFGGEKWISPTEKWRTLKIKKGGKVEFSADRNFYIRTRQL